MDGKSQQTTVFISGNSQAGSIPAVFRVDRGSLIIERVPEGLLLRPVEESFGDVIVRLRQFQGSARDYRRAHRRSRRPDRRSGIGDCLPDC